ncbi:MAG: cysteine--tRNA ligase [Gemmatimonadales bacterium]
MTLRLWDTMRRALVDFAPIAPPRVTMYTCGPTIYNYAHIGNFRTFLFQDLLRRWLEERGHAVFHVMNLTDVDDKTIKGALAAGTSLTAHTQPYAEAFFEDRDWLRIRPAHAYPRATEFIPQQVGLVERLLANGTAYKGEDGSVYFAIARFPAYGRLSRLDTRELKPGASERVSADEYAKEDARDFVLWKAARPEDEQVGAAWDAPFGRGRPGWHLECSAMALSLIGERFGADVLDIHAGAVDLIFPHHEDEIAQSCAYTGRDEFARYWVHGEFLNVRGTKMSKRWGNITTARDLREDGVPPEAVRLLVSTTHYRGVLDLTDEALAAAREGSRRLGEFGARLAEELAGTGGKGGESENPALVDAAARFEVAFGAALDEDLNAPQAVAAVFDFVRDANRAMDGGGLPGSGAAGAWALAQRVLEVATPLEGRRVLAAPGDGGARGAWAEAVPAGAQEAVAWAEHWAGRRLEARGRRDYAEADRIRAFLGAAGFEIRDRKDGGAEVVRSGRAGGAGPDAVRS